MSVSPDWLHFQAEVYPERLALATPEGRWSFPQLDADVAHLAGILCDLGVAAGDRVAYHLPSSAEQVMLVHALTRLSAVLVPLNTRLTTAELSLILENADPALLVYHQNPVTGSAAVPAISMSELMSRTPRQPVADATLGFDNLHALVYTSGTTGLAKGVELTVGSQWWSAVGFGLNAGFDSADRWLNVMPLFHVGGLTILFRSVIHGSSVFLEPRFDAASAHQLMDQEEVSLLSVVPTMLGRLLELPRSAPPSLRLVLLGGAPAAPALVAKAREQGYPAVPTYGMTETCSQVVTAQRDGEPISAASGHVNLPTRVRIMAEEKEAPPGHLGEIWISGPTVARGYWRNPVATAEAFEGGWLKTGDIGMLDSRGLLTVTDRVKDLIIRGGENVSPNEIELVLLSVPQVVDAAVFGLSHPHWGQEVAAAVVADSSLTLEELRNFLSNRLASYKIPSIYFRLDAIPRNAAGKVLRPRLAQEAETRPRWVDSR